MADEKHSFAVLQAGERLRDVDEVILAELYDLGYKFGRDLLNRPLHRRLSLEGTRPLHLTIETGDRKMMQLSPAVNFLSPSSETLIVFGTEARNSCLIMDRSLQKGDLLRFIAEAIARFGDARDPVTNERLRIDQPAMPPPKIDVDDLFRRFPQGITMPRWTTREAVLERVSDPDAVEFKDDPDSPCGFRLMPKPPVGKGTLH